MDHLALNLHPGRIPYLYVTTTHNPVHLPCVAPKVIDPSLIREVEARMKRNYLPPSLMNGTPQQMSSPEGFSQMTAMLQGPSGSMGVSSPVHPLFSGSNSVAQQQPTITSMVNVMKSTATSLDTSGAPPTTRRSISFSGGVPTSAHNSVGGGQHPFQQQYVQMLPPPAHNNYQPQSSPGPQQPVLAHLNSPAQPIRLGRIERFSRTCKLPTVQEVGKLHSTGSTV